MKENDKPSDQSYEGERSYAYSSNLKVKLANFLATGQVKTTIAVNAQRAPIWGRSWPQHTWWEVQPGGIFQPIGDAYPPTPELELEQVSPPRLEQEPKK